MTTRIAVTGATGDVGGRVVRRLVDRGEALRQVVRDADRAPDLPGTEVAVAGYGNGTAMRAALDGVRTLFLVSGEEAPDRLEQHRTAVRAAAEAGVQRVVCTSFLDAAPDATFTLARDHFHTEQAMAEAGLSSVALRDDGIDGPLDVTGPELLTLGEIADIITEATGRPVR
jgi:NAD(P)H dehydrogenase (quinone)